MTGPDEVIPLTEQFDNHDGYRPEGDDSLAGRELELHLKDGSTMTVDFASATRLSWRSDADQEWGREGTEDYEATLLRPGVVLVVVARLAERVSLLAVVDLDAGRAILNHTRLVGDGADVHEVTTFAQAGIGGPIGRLHERSAELVGKRIHHRYSDTHVYEHIYLEERLFAYHGVSGPEAGIADVDDTDTYKLRDELYLFSWHESVQPFNGAIVIDLAVGRTAGRLFGWDRDSASALQIRSGSVSTLLNETSFEGL